MRSTAPTDYRFGRFTLDCRNQRLLRENEPLPLTARTFEVLLALVRRRGQLIPKEELLQLVWGDVAVTEANLTQQIFILRRLFGDEARCIVTVPRRGYRFTADVVEHCGEPAGEQAAQAAHAKARYYMNRRTPGGFRRAIGHLNRAIEHDPCYARAYADLAHCHALDAATVLARADRMAVAKAAAQRALDLDEGLAEAHAAAASIAARWDWNWPLAEHEFRRAIDLDPSSASVRHAYALFLCWMGRPDEAIAEMTRAAALDPLCLIFRVGVGRLFDIFGRHDEAVVEYERALDIDPEFAEAYFDLAMALRHLGRNREALAADLKAVGLAPDKPMYRGGLASSYALTGRRAQARQEVDSLVALSRGGYVSPVVLAFAVLALDHVDGALTYLERAVAERSVETLYLGVDPDCRSLRHHRRFQLLIERIGLPPSARRF